jgi:RNA polymerase sigma factor (sigma-70 family)
MDHAHPDRSDAQPGDLDAAAHETALLVRAAANGCQRSWNEIVDRYAGRVWAVARAHRLETADAADVSQTTWLRLVEHLPRLTAPERVGAWLATTAQRESLRIIRRGRREWPDDTVIADAVAPPRDLDHELVISERDTALWQASSRLGPRDQILLRMLLEDPAPSYEEIGAALDMPIGSIGPTRRRALERLRLELDAAGTLDAVLA